MDPHQFSSHSAPLYLKCQSLLQNHWSREIATSRQIDVLHQAARPPWEQLHQDVVLLSLGLSRLYNEFIKFLLSVSWQFQAGDSCWIAAHSWRIVLSLVSFQSQLAGKEMNSHIHTHHENARLMFFVIYAPNCERIPQINLGRWQDGRTCFLPWSLKKQKMTSCFRNSLQLLQASPTRVKLIGTHLLQTNRWNVPLWQTIIANAPSSFLTKKLNFLSAYRVTTMSMHRNENCTKQNINKRLTLKQQNGEFFDKHVSAFSRDHSNNNFCSPTAGVISRKTRIQDLVREPNSWTVMV